MNEGIVIKSHAGQKYTSDAVSIAIFKAICEKAGVPVSYTHLHQRFRLQLPSGHQTVKKPQCSHILLRLQLFLRHFRIQLQKKDPSDCLCPDICLLYQKAVSYTHLDVYKRQEVDVSCFKCGGKGCRFCKGSGWIEILGCGMVHPHVLEMCGIDPEEYTGFAFGVGLERIALLKYEIDDMRLLYENDIRFLKQF